MKRLLQGKTILVTRAAGQADLSARRIEERGGTPVLFPTIEITPSDSWEACDRAIGELSRFDGVIFTSANGVKYFFDRLTQCGSGPEALSGKKIFVVGEKTKEQLAPFGLGVTAMPEKFTARALAGTIGGGDLRARVFLFPCGSLSSDTLTAELNLLGAEVHRAVVYQTRRPPQPAVDKLRADIFADRIDVATFTSPSTFRNFVPLFSPVDFRRIQRHIRIAVIGPATRHAVNEAGLDADIVAEKSTMESLLDAISSYFDSQHRRTDP